MTVIRIHGKGIQIVLRICTEYVTFVEFVQNTYRVCKKTQLRLINSYFSSMAARLEVMEQSRMPYTELYHLYVYMRIYTYSSNCFGHML